MSSQSKSSNSANTRFTRRGIGRNPYRKGRGYGYTFHFKTESWDPTPDQTSNGPHGLSAIITTTDGHTTKTQKKQDTLESPHAVNHCDFKVSDGAVDGAAVTKDEAVPPPGKDAGAAAATSAPRKDGSGCVPDEDEWTFVRDVGHDDDWTVISSVN